MYQIDDASRLGRWRQRIEAELGQSQIRQLIQMWRVPRTLSRVAAAATKNHCIAHAQPSARRSLMNYAAVASASADNGAWLLLLSFPPVV